MNSVWKLQWSQYACVHWVCLEHWLVVSGALFILSLASLVWSPYWWTGLGEGFGKIDKGYYLLAKKRKKLFHE